MSKTTYNGAPLDESRSLIPIDIKGDRVMIRQIIKKEEKTSSGIIKPGIDENDIHREGEVVCIGPGFPDSPVEVALKERVYYHHNSAVTLYLKNEEETEEWFDVVRSSDILAVL